MNTFSRIRQKIYPLFFPLYRMVSSVKWKKYLRENKKIRLNIGAGDTFYPGWFWTDLATLDMTDRNQYLKLLGGRKINNILCEHVLEHLDDDQVKKFAECAAEFGAEDICVRIAVPDGFHTNPVYIDKVKPFGSGKGAHDHKQLFNYKNLSAVFEKAEFKAELVEYWDEHGVFHTVYEDDDKGYVRRSAKNKSGDHNVYSSLIIDFYKSK